jgi:hypothetical protein
LTRLLHSGCGCTAASLSGSLGGAPLSRCGLASSAFEHARASAAVGRSMRSTEGVSGIASSRLCGHGVLTAARSIEAKAQGEEQLHGAPPQRCGTSWRRLSAQCAEDIGRRRQAASAARADRCSAVWRECAFVVALWRCCAPAGALGASSTGIHRLGLQPCLVLCMSVPWPMVDHKSYHDSVAHHIISGGSSVCGMLLAAWLQQWDYACRQGMCLVSGVRVLVDVCPGVEPLLISGDRGCVLAAAASAHAVAAARRGRAAEDKGNRERGRCKASGSAMVRWDKRERWGDEQTLGDRVAARAVVLRVVRRQVRRIEAPSVCGRACVAQMLSVGPTS